MTSAMTHEATGRYDLGSIERIPPGEGQTFRVGGREIAVFRSRDDVVHATQARCPHKAGLLADGLMGDGKIICPLHSYKFELATGTSVGNGCESLRTFHAEVTADRRVIVTVSSDSGAEWSDGP
jgi:nitrite reductase (NADH) small subunit